MRHATRHFALTLVLMLLAAASTPVLQAQQETVAPAKVNINAGTVEQLSTLPGVGPATAQKILEFRSKNGPFKRIEDLMAVQGIGEKKFLKLKDRITL
ncbi:MAG: helix-hairpin-helix domain-containing protein [Acidobacteria bacterium]|nr:helix-hairpin-helix domain-containing protein [Acidobacteriota bacterium]